MRLSFRLPPVVLASLLAAGMLFTGCGRSTVRTSFKDPDFSLADLRRAPSLLVVSPNVQVTAFQKSYAKLFPVPESLTARVSRKLLDSLSLDSVVSANALPDSAVPDVLPRTGARYVLYVHRISIGDSLTEIPDVLLPGVNGMAPSGGGSSKICVATFEVEVLDGRLKRLYAFNVRAQADVTLYAYKTAVLKAVDAASRKTAAHLSGR